MITGKQQKIVNALKNTDYLQRKDIVKKTGIPRTTAYTHIMRLVDKGIVKKDVKEINKRGRNPVIYTLLHTEGMSYE